MSVLEVGLTSHQSASSISAHPAPRSPPPAATNLLHEIDRGAHQVMDAISAAQELRPGGAPGTVQFSGEIPSLRMDRPVRRVRGCCQSL